MHGLGDKPSQGMESLLVKQLLESSGAFHSTDAAGSKLTTQLFTEAIADAIAKAGGLGVAKLIDHSLDPNGTPAPDASTGAPGVPGQGWPSSGSKAPGVTSGFGARIDPITHLPSNHPGVDLHGTVGEPIPAAEDGVVVSAGDRGGYGNAVEIAHPDGTHTLYAHASTLLVSPGETVHAGQTIATVGETGRTTGPHLHFELRRGGVPVDPTKVLKTYRLRAEEGTGGES